jgi:hypothetical protein
MIFTYKISSKTYYFVHTFGQKYLEIFWKWYSFLDQELSNLFVWNHRLKIIRVPRFFQNMSWFCFSANVYTLNHNCASKIRLGRNPSKLYLIKNLRKIIRQLNNWAPNRPKADKREFYVFNLFCWKMSSK